MAPAPRPAAAQLGNFRPLLEELSASTGIDQPTLAALVERAVTDTYARVMPAEAPVRVRFDLDSGVVSLERDGPDGEPGAVRLPPDVARQSAQAIKVAVAGRLREAERDRVIAAGHARRGELVDGIVEREDAMGWWLRVEGLEALLEPVEQIAGERLTRHQHVKVVVIDTLRRARDAALKVSRTHPALLRRLLEQEVPELSTGQVVVRALAREAGRRSKVAVEAPAGGIDAEGACIGPKGVRIRAVVAELGEEQVHVVGWSDDPAVYVARALGPAQVTSVDLDEETRTAHCTVPDGQLSLAIGRAGENARLAARLTGWRIDIRGDGEPG